ncbi:MAG: glutamate-1-semialdehyde-2,1-aminomutase [Betaproteobacteria bacterium]|nr:glutamate-1-semialdehyde-2,1-aminomutase [Betaproteobacteria bacterium]NCX21851.1 glutamate-1-semialdehyde-2,1-aminomutase [Betaproteobacteria bacterium]NCX88239.1 glutamate-1-semialdehyde-2,1-aminomutase [Betaproteobacteria bacterium]NDA32605.1 glutamate-1-semialdehyde-2,1-aminomutase [Betaproteobacteria bacterium]NDC70716.1 glutamate-1-semialdehyde-2,1-aminomutase [Betaproteobacteria bacterium]
MTTRSNAQEFARAQQSLVGGVNSAVRAFRAVGGTPRFIDRAQGAYMWDVEGKRYIDYLGSWGPMIVGQAHPVVVRAVQEAALRGLSYGAPNVMETELAERMKQIHPHMERVRFTSSGTEAAMSALRLARGATGRTKILKFEGCYHGTADSLLVKAGSGALAFGTPSSAGVPADLAQHTLVASYNDLPSVQALFDQYPGAIACVMVEPLPGNMNLMMPEPGFLEGLQSLCRRDGALLIFDEVMSGFRVALGGAQEVTGITPDVSAFGKVIGGGMPVGAFGGPAAVMEHMAPLGPVYQAGTLSGNPIAMAAGLATLDLIQTAGFFEALSAKTSHLIQGLSDAAAHHKLAFSARSVGGMAGMYFMSKAPRNFAEIQTQDSDAFKRFFHRMLEQGVYFPPSTVEAFFTSSALSDEDIDFTVQAAERAFAQEAASPPMPLATQ